MPSAVDDSESPANLPPVTLTPQVIFQVLASEIAIQRGQAGSAVATYLSLATQTRDPRLARRATEIAIAERSFDGALQGARLWRELAPRSTLAAQMLETILLSAGRLPEAEPLLSQRLEQIRKDGDVGVFYRQFGLQMARSSDPAAALALLDRLSIRDTAQPEARLAAALIADAAGKPARAVAEATRAYALKPDDERIAIVTARLLRNTPAGQLNATRLLEGFVKRHPAAAEARFQLARMHAEAGNVGAAREHMEIALRDNPDNPAAIFSLAQIAHQARQPELSEDYLKRYLALPDTVRRDEGLAHLFLAQIEEEQGRPERAIEWLAKVTDGERRLPALAKRAMLMGRLGQIEEARALLSTTQAETPREKTQLVLAESQVLREARRNEEAFQVLDRALAQSADDPDLLYDHAMAAERLDRIDVMEGSFRKLLALRPDHAHALNALGYSLADRNLRLPEAYELIRRALELSPEDPHILDSMGWVLFRMGRLEEAVRWLERALAIRAEAEIAAHLGEVLWQLGRTEEARRAWRKAKAADPDNATLRSTLSRLDVSL
jgi:tetratricopeptide (TPR) repeat protein